MSNQSSRKFGFLAAIVVLTMILCLVMAGCNNEQATATTTAPAATTGEQGTEQVDLYWNIDRAQYDGKSEAGMSSREPAEDGYFHVRFFKDGEIVELRVADRKTVNALEVNDLMGLEFDKDGIVIGVKAVDDLPVEQIAWQFYVQSVGGKLIKTNSSASMNGMEILVETDENTGIYDMSGVTGEIGPLDKPMQGDRVLILGDGNGKVTHVFVYERPNYMESHEGYCEHCEKDVTWLEWKREKALPTTSGHYQLVADLKDVPQNNIQEDQKICFDLNGHRVDGASGRRIWSMHNGGIELALMDTSEAKTGRIAAHGQGDQGMCIWVRYGVFYMYGGILDGSDAKTQKNSPTLNMGGNTYMYMYGGEIIGGTSIPIQDAKGNWSAGISGTMQINTGAKFVMYDGLIHKGKAMAVVTKYDANGRPSSYSAGLGGNIVINGGIMEMHGGTIRDGYARQSGNIHMMGKGEFYMYDGLISNGQAYGKGGNGGNLYAGANNIIEMRGGTIRNGRTMNCGGNVYFNGKFVMTDGIITDGKCYNWSDGKLNDVAASRNLFGVQGDFYMYGGRVAGGVNMIDSANDKNQTIILVSGRAVIFDEDGTGPHLTLSDTAGGTKCIMYVGQLHDEAKIGISKVQTAVFTEPTNKNNVDNFVSDIEGADVAWSENGLVMGKVHCMCSQDPEVTTHKPGCDGVQYAWAPWNSSPMPGGNANYYLTKDITLTGGTTIGDNVTCRVDLNGYTATYDSQYRIYSFLNAENSTLTITDTSEAQTGALVKTNTTGTQATGQGGIVWGGLNSGNYVSKNNTFNLIAGTLDSTDFVVQQGGSVIDISGGNMVVNMYGGHIKGGQIIPKDSTNYHGGAILVEAGHTFNMYGGTIEGGRAKGGCQGGNIAVRGTMNMYGGTIKNGDWDGATSDANIRLFNNGTYGSIYMYGGTIAGGIEHNSHGGPAYMYVSGKVVIDKNLTDEGNAVPTMSLRAGGVQGENFQPLEIGELEEGSSIYVTTSRAVFSNVTKAEYAQYFHADNGTSNIVWIDNAADFGLEAEDEGKLFCGNVRKSCMCGTTGTEHALGCDGITYTWHELTDVLMLKVPGNYYMTKDITTSEQIAFAKGTTRLDFNGYTLTDTDWRLFTTNGSTDAKVWFTDTSANKAGGLSLNKNGNSYTGQGVGMWLAGTGCEANWLAGTMDASKVTNVKYGGAAVYVSGNTTFNLYGGEIKGGVATRDAGQTYSKGSEEPKGGAIRICANGTFNMYDGIVSGGKCVGCHGGNITIEGTMNMWDGTVKNGTTGKYTTSNTDGHGGNIALNANGAVLNIYGGEIIDGASVGWAGNIYCYPGSTGTVTVNMSGGKISGGKASSTDLNKEHSNIGLRNGSVLNLSGGEITGRIACNASNTATVKLSGSIRITESASNKRLWISPLDANGTPDIKLVIGKFNSDAKVYFTNNCKTYNNVLYGLNGLFATAEDGYTITADDVAKLNHWIVNNASATGGKNLVLRDNAIYYE